MGLSYFVPMYIDAIPQESTLNLVDLNPHRLIMSVNSLR